MGAFLDRLVAEEIDPVSDRPQWRLHEPLRFYSSTLREIVVVPSGFETDFASVPRVPIAWLIAGGTANDAAVVHDWLCVKGLYTSVIAAKVFLEAMKDLGISFLRRTLMYWAVRLFGPQW